MFTDCSLNRYGPQAPLLVGWFGTPPGARRACRLWSGVVGASAGAHQQYLQTQAPAFLAEVMDFGLTFVGDLQRSSSTLAAGLYDRVLGPDDQSSSAPEPAIVLELRGPAGSVVSSTVVVENSRADTADVTCRVSEFTARAFGPRFRAALHIDPARFTPAPGAQQDVSLGLTLDPSLFAADADDVATLQISGAGGTGQLLSVEADS